ncbi:MAG: hypothetical protein WAX85_00435 [Minisyncoccia bacterium]
MKNFIAKVILFILIIIFVQVMISRFIAPQIISIPLGIPGIRKLDKYLYDHYKVIYFGDSVIRATSPNDVDQSSIVQMFSKISPGLTVGDLSSPAYHLGIFEAMADYISRSQSKPEAIIVPINLRSFSPEWDMRPEYQFENEIFFLTSSHFLTYFSKPLSVLHLVKTNTVSIDTYLSTPVYYGKTIVGIVKKYQDEGLLTKPEPENIKDFYILDYMYSLNESHRKLISLSKLIDIAQKSGIKVYPYVIPIDWEGGIKYVGSDFTKQVGTNIKVICSEIKKRNAPCLDISFGLSSDNFIHGDYPNEHLSQKGREFVAKQVHDFFFKNEK